RHETCYAAVLAFRQRPLKGAMLHSGVQPDQLVKTGLEPAFVTIAGGSGEQQIVAKIVIGSIRGAHGPELLMVYHVALIAIEQQVCCKTGVGIHDEAPANGSIGYRQGREDVEKGAGETSGQTITRRFRTSRTICVHHNATPRLLGWGANRYFRLIAK